MQLYFIKATFTNNVYKLSDFFVGSNYNLIATKMLDINFKPDDGLSSFITSKIILPDETKIWDHTHIIVPEYSKIYRIASIDYVNNDQYNVTLDEDPLIANYQTLKGKDIILTRSNDAELFRGVNDISDLTLKETVETKSIESLSKTGRWALLFFQVNFDSTFLGLRFEFNATANNFETFATLNDLLTAYPEVDTNHPSEYSYFQKIVEVTGTHKYQCVYDASPYDIGGETNYYSRLRWVEYTRFTEDETIYFLKSSAGGSKVNPTEVKTICIALPFESDLKISQNTTSYPLVTFNDFVGPVNAGDLIDIKIIDSSLLKIDSVSYSLSTREMIKTLTFEPGSAYAPTIYEGAETNNPIASWKILSVYYFEDDFEISADFDTSLVPTKAEPFYKYDLYIYGKKFTVPYYLTNDVRIKIAVNTGVINYIVYYNNPRNILASGSFTHSIKYQVDQLDSFYNQNPTYKEQFFTKMAIDSMKGIVGGGIAGSVVPGLGTVAGFGLGALSSGVDAGVSLLNLHYQEKGLRLKPDQVFGEISEVSLQIINIFGIYWVKRTSENLSMMKVEYDMRGFPTLRVEKIADLTGATGIFGTSIVVYGELKEVIKNEFVTGFINQKLKEGIVII